MKKIKIQDQAVMSEVKAVLESGGIVMHPTETCYGLAVDVFSQSALDKLYRVKGMERNKPLSVLVDGFEMAKRYGEFSEKALKLAEKYWPGPLAIIVPRKNLPEFFNMEDGFVSFRCSSDKFCVEMVKVFGRPVTTTSANRGGMPQLYEANEAEFGEFAEELDLVVDGGKIQKNKPSTIVKIEGDKLTVVRQGDLLVEEFREG